MNKSELIAMITERSDLTKAQVETVFKATFDLITDVLSKQDKITIPGFGGFSSKKRPARKGRNPSTGKEMTIPEAVVASFKPAAQLKEFINIKGSDDNG